MKDYLGESKKPLNKIKVGRSHVRAVLYAGAIVLAVWFSILPERYESEIKVKTMRVVVI